MRRAELRNAEPHADRLTATGRFHVSVTGRSRSVA